MQVTSVVEGKNLWVRLVTNDPHYKPLYDVYRGDVFLYILEVILFHTFNKVLLNYSLSNADFSVLSNENSIFLAYILSRHFN